MKVQKLKDQCAAVESDIASHEAEIAKLEAELVDFRSTDETLRVTRLLEDKRATLEGLMSRWEEDQPRLRRPGSSLLFAANQPVQFSCRVPVADRHAFVSSIADDLRKVTLSCPCRESLEDKEHRWLRRPRLLRS